MESPGLDRRLRPSHRDEAGIEVYQDYACVHIYIKSPHNCFGVYTRAADFLETNQAGS